MQTKPLPVPDIESPLNLHQVFEKLLLPWELKHLNEYICRLLHHLIISSPRRIDACVSFEEISDMYHNAEQSERAWDTKQRNSIDEAVGVMERGSKWGYYTLSMVVRSVLLAGAAETMYLFLQIPGGQNMKLVYLIDYLCEECKMNHVSDVRHLMYLVSHPERVPGRMQDGTLYLFIGTIVLVASEPHIFGATWKNGKLREELVSLTEPLERDAHVVLLVKN